MAITIQAIYENGVLRPTQPLPLQEHEHVQVTVHRSPDREGLQRGYGLLPWTGPLADLDYLIDDDENDPLEGP